MDESTINKYKAYDFGADSKWMEYLGRLEPMPPVDKLNKLKKRWYKNNVDQTFDPEADLYAPRTNTPPPQYSSYQSTAAPEPRPFAQHKLYHIEGLLKVAFCVGCFVVQFLPFLQFYLLLISVSISALAILRQIGPIKFSKEYLQSLIQNDFGVSLFYIFAILTVNSRGPFVYLPLILHYMLGVAEFEPRTNYPFLKFSKVQEFLSGVRQMKQEIHMGRAYIEFFNAFYFLILIILGKLNILFMLIYFNYIKFKFKLNPVSYQAMHNTKLYLKAKANGLPGVGMVLNKVVDGIFWLLSF